MLSGKLNNFTVICSRTVSARFPFVTKYANSKVISNLVGKGSRTLFRKIFLKPY